jgi:hypothetical protein
MPAVIVTHLSPPLIPPTLTHTAAQAPSFVTQIGTYTPPSPDLSIVQEEQNTVPTQSIQHLL